MSSRQQNHLRYLLQGVAEAQAEIDYLDCLDSDCRPSRDRSWERSEANYRRRVREPDDYDDEDDDDDDLQEIYSEIEQLKIIAAQNKPRYRYGPAPAQCQPQQLTQQAVYNDSNQKVLITGLPDPNARSNVMDTVFIPEDVDVEYDKNGVANIYKRQGCGGMKADVINVPHKGVGQKYPEESVDAFLPLEGNHTFKVDAPSRPQPIGHAHAHAHAHAHCGGGHQVVRNCQPGGGHPVIVNGQPGGLPQAGPIVGQNGQVLVPTGRYVVEKVRVPRH